VFSRTRYVRQPLRPHRKRSPLPPPPVRLRPPRASPLLQPRFPLPALRLRRLLSLRLRLPRASRPNLRPRLPRVRRPNLRLRLPRVRQPGRRPALHRVWGKLLRRHPLPIRVRSKYSTLGHVLGWPLCDRQLSSNTRVRPERSGKPGLRCFPAPSGRGQSAEQSAFCSSYS
jgi:hypothetical protein